MATVVFGYYQVRVKEEVVEEEEEEERSVVEMGHYIPSPCPLAASVVPSEKNHHYACDFMEQEEEEESELEFCENLFDSLDIPEVKSEATWFGTNEDIFSSGQQQQPSLVCDEVLNDTFDSSEGTLSDSTQSISPPPSPPQPPTVIARRRRARQPRYLRNAWLTSRERKKYTKITKKKPLVPTPIILKEDESLGIRPGHYKISATGRLGLVRPWNVAMDQFPERRQDSLVNVNLFQLKN